MNHISTSDLAQSLILRQGNARLRVDLQRYAQELSSGRKANLPETLGGNFNALAGFERGLSRAEGYLTVVAESRLETDAMQSSVDLVRRLSQGIAGTLLNVPDTGDPLLVDTVASDTSDRFSAAISALNTQSGGRSLFSGVATDVPALTDEETILAAIEAAILAAGATTATEVTTVVESWFGPGGDFEVVGYIGAFASRGPLQISEGETLTSQVRGDDLRFRDTLAGLALGAVLDRGVLSGLDDERSGLAQTAGRKLLEADRQLVNVQSQIGVQQSQIERAQTEIKGEKDALELARSELVGIDPFETATRLQDAENQLRSLYALTAKLSRLTLTDFI